MVHANIMRLFTSNPERHSITVHSKDSNPVEIPLEGYNEVKWKIMLNW